MATRGSGGADGLMLRVDGSKFTRLRGRRHIAWIVLGLLLIGGILLGLLAPQAATSIEIWGGPGAALIGW